MGVEHFYESLKNIEILKNKLLNITSVSVSVRSRKVKPKVRKVQKSGNFPLN